MRTPVLSSRKAPRYEAMAPVFIAVLAGIGVFAVAPTMPTKLLGLVIIAAAFMLTDMLTVKRVLLAVIIFEIPIQIDIYLGYDAILAAQQVVTGYNISVTTVCLIALYMIWATERLSGADPADPHLLRSVLPVILYTLVVLATVLYAAVVPLVLFEFVIVVQAALLLIYVAHAVRSKGDALMVVGLLLLSVLVQFGLSALAVASGSAVQIGVITADFIGNRLAGTVGHPNSFGGYLAMVLPVTAAMVLAPVRSWYRWMAAGAFVTGVVLLGLTQSRGGFFGLAAGLGVVAAVVYARQLVSRRVLMRALALAAIPLAIQLALVASRLAAYDNDAATGRLPLIALGFEMILANPILGVGANNFTQGLDALLTIDYSASWIATVHNKYLLLWSETGVLGFVTFMWLMIAAVSRAIRVTGAPERLYAVMATGILGGLSAALVHMLVELYHSRPLLQTLFLLVGLLIALERLAASAKASAVAAEIREPARQDR